MRAEYKTIVWGGGWRNDWISVIVSIGGKSRELRRVIAVAKTDSDGKNTMKAISYARDVCERYNRWSKRQ